MMLCRSPGGIHTPDRATRTQCYSLCLLLKYASWCSLSETGQGSSAISAILWWEKGPKLAPKYVSDNDQCRAVDGWSVPLQGLNDGGLQVAMFLCCPKPWYKLESILKILFKDNTFYSWQIEKKMNNNSKSNLQSVNFSRYQRMREFCLHYAHASCLFTYSN